MPRPSPLTFSTFMVVPEVCPAVTAVQDVLACVCSGRTRRLCNPVYLHGQTGTGKTHLVSALAEAATRQAPQLVVNIVSAGDRERFEPPRKEDALEGATEPLHGLRNCDLLIVEDLQYLPPRHARPLSVLFDELLSRQVQMVFTARVGPRCLGLPSRLTSRLASGLVVGLKPLEVNSRRTVLADKAQRNQQPVAPAILDWLAEKLTGGGRQLQGTLAQLETLARSRREPLDLPTVARHFREHADAGRLSIERIAQEVGSLFSVELRALRSERRGRGVVLPRQVSMYLARQLTGLSLEQIGDYFGGRDHSTVLHACRKVEQALTEDTLLSGTVRQLTLDLA